MQVYVYILFLFQIFFLLGLIILCLFVWFYYVCYLADWTLHDIVVFKEDDCSFWSVLWAETGDLAFILHPRFL